MRPMTADTVHETSLAVWDIAPAVAAGEIFSVKVGAKSSGGCALNGRRIEVLDGDAVVASDVLGETPWPGSTALFWTELEMRAPPRPGTAMLAARVDATASDPSHRGTTLQFHVSVVAKPEHVLTVKVTAAGAPIEEAYIRLGPYRAITDASGMAQVKMAKGGYELVVWKAGYDMPATPVTIEADAVVPVEARALPEDDPDSVWTA
jgi:hypothetical protein